MDDIKLRGVRVHNLRDVDVDIPRGRLTVLTGVSGSGKSSLAFDTLYAEGQRRYVESLSTYARQFLERMERPDVEAIEGIPPAVAIRQAAPAAGGRSTVGTVTEIQDYLRLLWARIGKTWCLKCGRPVEVDTVDRIAERFLAAGGGERRPASRLLICFPVDASAVLKTVTPAEFLDDLRANGFQRIRIDGRMMTIDEARNARLTRRCRLAVVVDRLAGREESRGRLTESLETAYRFGHGRCLIVEMDGQGAVRGEHPFSSDLHCAACDIGYAAAMSFVLFGIILVPSRRLSVLPGVRSLDRAGHEPHRPGPRQDAEAASDRAMELPVLLGSLRRSGAGRAKAEGSSGCSLRRAEAGAPAMGRRWGRSFLRDQRILPLAGVEDLQGPRARVPLALPHVPPLR